MKNKKNIYFLLPAVLVVWGLLGYRIFSAVQPKSINTDLNASQLAFTPHNFKESESFTIKADYRDPFLGTINKVHKKPKKRPKAKTEQEPKKPFPQIHYKGLVSGQY